MVAPAGSTDMLTVCRDPRFLFTAAVPAAPETRLPATQWRRALLSLAHLKLKK